MISNTTCNIHTLILVTIAILIIAFTEELFEYFPVIIKLFTDPVNFILLIVLVILVLLIDIPSGIILTFIILYIAIWIKRLRKNNINRFADITIATKLASNNNKDNSIPKYRTDSEMYYDNKVMPNRNLAPFKPTETTDTTQTFIPTVNTIPSQNTSKTTTPNINNNGFDVSGCRYDFKDTPQNSTIFGPPISSCNTYDANQMAKYGTLFYPLNA